MGKHTAPDPAIPVTGTRPSTSASPTVGVVVDEDRKSVLIREAMRFAPNAGRMIYRSLRDPRVTTRTKAEVAGCVALLAVPLEAIPVVGELEIAAVLTLAVGRLMAGAGEELMREHWDGSEAGFRAFQLLATVGFKPRKALKNIALSRIGVKRS